MHRRYPKYFEGRGEEMKFRKKPVVIEALQFDGSSNMEYCKQCVRHTFILKDLFEKKERTPNE